MTLHIGATPGEIAETILMPGDPYRAKWAAETFLDNPKCVNDVRYARLHRDLVRACRYHSRFGYGNAFAVNLCQRTDPRPWGQDLDPDWIMRRDAGTCWTARCDSS